MVGCPYFVVLLKLSGVFLCVKDVALACPVLVQFCV